MSVMHRIVGRMAVLAWLLPGASISAQAGGRTHLIVIAGVGGEPKYAQEFHAAASAVIGAARDRYGVTDSSIIYLGEKPAVDPRLIRGVANRAGVEGAFSAVAARARPDDRLLVLLIGHGSSQDGVARFNIVGPDLTAADFAAMLSRVPARRVAFVNASSASGDFVKALAAPGRIVVTATKSGFERNESVFFRHFAAAYASDGADADKDGRISLLEAFDFARREVAREYEQDNRLLTEHAQLDDDGDGVGTAEPAARSKDGALARTFFLGGGESAAASDPRLAPLIAEKERWEARVDSLRRNKDRMDAAVYERELEAALIELAKVNQSIRAGQGGGRKP